MPFVDLVKNPLVLFALGCFVTYLFYRLQRNYRRLSCQRSDMFVVDPKIGQMDAEVRQNEYLEVRFAGEPVPRVTQTIIRFWNSGTETIHKNDLSSMDPLRLQLPDDARCLSVCIDKKSRPANVVTVEPEANRLIINFDFLDRNDGATVSVLHTAPPRKARIEGIIKGGKVDHLGSSFDAPQVVAITERSGSNSGKWFGRCMSLLIYGLFIASIVMTLSGIFPDYFLDTFPYFFSDAPNEPDIVRGRINVMRTLQGIVCSAFFGGICFAILSIWKNKPPEALRLDRQ